MDYLIAYLFITAGMLLLILASKNADSVTNAILLIAAIFWPVTVPSYCLALVVDFLLKTIEGAR